MHFFQTSEIVKLQKSICPNFQPKAQLSVDGVAECRSNSISLDVFSIKFSNCKNIFPVKIVRPLEKYKMDPKDQLREILQEFEENGIQLEQFVADNLKRATFKGSLNHASNFPCEYCFGKGVRLLMVTKSQSKLSAKNIKEKKTLDDKIKRLRNKPSTSNNEEIDKLIKKRNDIELSESATLSKKSKIVWPSSTSHAEPRTIAKISEILDKIEQDEKLSKDERKGIVNRSVLFDVPNFDYIRDSPAEYMHSVCLGLVKRLVELTFNVGENRPRKTTRKLSDAAMFNKLMQSIRVTKEFSRRARDLDFAVYKAEEFRNIILFFFPLVIKCIPECEKERRLWLLLAFAIRACCLSTEEFQPIQLSWINDACDEFYTLYEQLYTSHNCTYNTHVVCAHLIEIRAHGPLTKTSAFMFESFYGEMRKCFTPGTKSQLKQILQKVALKRALSHHCCENSVLLSNHKTDLENNSVIYTYSRNEYSIYHVKEIFDDHLLCVKQNKYNMSFPETPELNWGKVGVFKRGPLSATTVNVPVSDVCGKVLEVENLLITCPKNVLLDK